MMTSLERIGSLMSGQLPDRVPVMCNLFEQGASELGMPIKEYYSKPEYVAEAQILMQKKYGYDGIWAFTYTAAIAEIVGCRNIIYSEDGPPNAGHMIIQEYSDIEKFEIPDDIEQTAAMQNWIKLVKLVRSEAAGRVPVLTSIVASFTLPALFMGMEKWMELLFLGPRELSSMMISKCSLLNEKLITSLRAAGVDMFAYSNPMSTKTFLTYDQFLDLCLPWVKNDFKNTGVDGIVYFNGGGQINHILDTLIRETSIGAYYLNPFDDITEAKKIIAGRALCAGVINDIKLINWTPDEIRKDVKRIIEAGKEGGGFIFGTLVMPYAIPTENIHIMIDTASEAGSYGI